MKLIYREVLSPLVAEQVISMLRQYPHVIEIEPRDAQHFWDNFQDWAETAMPKYTITINSGSSGEDYQTDRILYGLVRKDDTASRFMFFKTKAEKDLFADRFEAIVAAYNPFQVILEV